MRPARSTIYGIITNVWVVLKKRAVGKVDTSGGANAIMAVAMHFSLHALFLPISVL